MFANGRIWLAYLIVFASSTCTMVIELVAGRIMAPYIGVSLYTWTSIIGIVLAGMSLGNYLGGYVADRRASREILGLVFLAGGLASLGILVMTNLVFSANLDLQGLPETWRLIARIVIYTTGIFFLPALVLGMVSPLVVKLALSDLTRTGGTVGTIYAFSTVGSIFGTFITGFVLISWLGTRVIVWIVGLVLIAMAVAVGGFLFPKGRLVALLATVVACGAALWLNSSQTLIWVSQEMVAVLPNLSAYLVLVVPALIVLAAAVEGGRLATPALVLSIAVGGVVLLGWNVGYYRAPCEVESNYFCIRVQETTLDGQRVRALVLDHLVHSYTSLRDPKVLGYGYERVYAELTGDYLMSRGRDENGTLDTLFIGGGGYTFPRYVEASYKHSTVDVMEIDPAVTEVARTSLNLGADTRVRSFNLDARTFLLGWPDEKKFDVIYGDAFNDLSVPYHLTTVEFDRMLADRLKPEGIYLVNVIDRYEGGEFMRAFANALKQVFPHVYLFSQADTFGTASANTYVLMASRVPFDYERFRQTSIGPDGTSLVTTMLSEARLDEYLRGGRGIALTDDFAPVDQLIAPLFVERGY